MSSAISVAWEIYTWVAVVSFTFSVIGIFYLFIRSELDIRRRKKKMEAMDADIREIMDQELNRERLRKIMDYKEDDKKED